MNASFPATLLPYPRQRYFPPLQPKPPNLFFLSSFKRMRNPQFFMPKSIQNSSCYDHTLLSIQWPQILKISIGSQDFLLGQAIHAYLLKSASPNDPFQGNNLINLYAKFGRLDVAQKVFDDMLERNTITWTSLITACLENQDIVSGFTVVCGMHKSGEKLNEHTCSVVLQACGKTLGEQIHGSAIKSGFEEDVVVATSLVSMYSRNGYFGEAESLFNGMACKDVRCLNFMILEYGRAGCGEKAIAVFVILLTAGLEPNEYTFTNIISTCNGDTGVEEGSQLHGLAFKYGFVSETSVGNAIITMYGKSGKIEEAERMFSTMREKNLITWTALISSYTRNGHNKNAVHVFLVLLDLGVKIDSSLLATVLDGCSECNNLELGLQLHGFVLKLGCSNDVNIGTALIDVYAKCRSLHSARRVFEGLSTKSSASLNAILAGFIENGDEEDPITCFSQLRLAGIKPDSVTFSLLLRFSANQASLVLGRGLQAYSIKTGFEGDVSLANAVITMYAKCGSIEDAYEVFKAIIRHDFVSWNAIISACGLHGQGQKALFLFEEMKRKGFFPDEITILAVLQACAYSGLWEYGMCLFDVMEQKYGIRPSLEHYACMVDLLGRAGCLPRAVDIVNSSSFSDSTMLWRTLVNSSKLCGDLNFGKLASKRLLALSPEEAGSYVTVSNLYAEEGLLDEASKVRTMMRNLKLSKEAGCSWIEIDNKVHHFAASSTDHPESREIYARLDLLRDEMGGKHDGGAELSLV